MTINKKAVVTNKKQLNTPAQQHNTAAHNPPAILPQITSENSLQAYLFKWAWNTYPQSRRHIWAVPNGAKRSRYEQNLMKATGLISGVYDLHCFWNGKFYAFELKYGKNKQSEEQSQWGSQMSQHGAIVYEIRETDIARWKEIIAGIFGGGVGDEGGSVIVPTRDTQDEVFDTLSLDDQDRWIIVKNTRTAKPAAAIPRAQDSGTAYDGNRSTATQGDTHTYEDDIF